MLKRVRLGTSLILICSRSSSILVIEMDCGRSEVLSSSSVKVSVGKTDCLYHQNSQKRRAKDGDHRVKSQHIELPILGGNEEGFNGNSCL